MAESGGVAVIVKWILFFLFLLVIALIHYFLFCILSPAVMKQTEIDDSMLFFKSRHDFYNDSADTVFETAADSFDEEAAGFLQKKTFQMWQVFYNLLKR